MLAKSIAKYAIFGSGHRPYIAPHTLRLGPDGLIYITYENSAVVAVINRTTHTVIDVIDSGPTNGHRLVISPDGRRLYEWGMCGLRESREKPRKRTDSRFHVDSCFSWGGYLFVYKKN